MINFRDLLSSTQWLVLACAAVAPISAACSSSSSPPAGDAGSAAQACSDQAAAICALRSSCSAGFNISLNFPGQGTCDSRTAAQCVSNLSAPGSGQTPAHVEACAAAYPGEACVDYFSGNPVPACVPPAGTQPQGAPCGGSAQCTSTYCAVSEHQVCGSCQPLPAVGASCQVGADCGRDLACAVPAGATSGTCAPYGAANAPCLTGVAPCAAGLACVGDDVPSSAKGTCGAAGAAVGAACDGSRKTAANCNGTMGLTCIPTANGSALGTCQKTQLAAAGAPCGSIGANPITSFALCAGGGLCAKQLTDAGTGAASGTCVAPAADGAVCDSDPTKGPPCLAPAKCVPSSSSVTCGTCTVPNASLCK